MGHVSKSPNWCLDFVYCHSSKECSEITNQSWQGEIPYQLSAASLVILGHFVSVILNKQEEEGETCDEVG